MRWQEKYDPSLREVAEERLRDGRIIRSVERQQPGLNDQLSAAVHVVCKNGDEGRK
jgi:hypothetical protein